MNLQETMMRQMFKVQIAMLGHVVVNGYREATGLGKLPDFSDLSAADQESLLKNVEFWLNNPTSPIAASHESWLATKIEEGWRLGETLDEQAKLSPFIRPFDSLPKDTRIMEELFRSAVRAVTYTQSAAPAYKRRMDLINFAIWQKFPDEPVETAGAKWNALPEDERMAVLADLQAKQDAEEALMRKRRERIEGTIKHFGLTPADWDGLTEDERIAKLDEHGALTGQGDFFSEQEKAQIAAQNAAMKEVAEGRDFPSEREVAEQAAPSADGMVAANDEPATPVKLSESADVAVEAGGQAPPVHVDSGPLEDNSGPVAGEVGRAP